MTDAAAITPATMTIAETFPQKALGRKKSCSMPKNVDRCTLR
jgi:hypothetical protein